MDTARPQSPYRIAVVQFGATETARTLTPATSKVPSVFPALAAIGMEGVPIAYHDDHRDIVRAALLGMDGVLVWVNPIESGYDRTYCDALLREVAAAGVFVSTHPDIIQRLGTKQVLVDTLDMSWSAPGTCVHRTPAELHASLSTLGDGDIRVLKQYRGHSGQGIWKVKRHSADRLRVREAVRGSPEMALSAEDFVARCASYFREDGRMIDQPYQRRLPEGMIRCYLVHDSVAGFGHQAVNALCPAPSDAPDAFPETTRRLYYPSDKREFQALKRQLEDEWVPQLKSHFGLTTDTLPVLWDCDFLLGEKDATGRDTYVLCEINVSSVSPFPDSALGPLAAATMASVRTAKARRQS
ncbi:MAG: Cj0069 family protein [Betaproteobacteria bacterium]|nr:Cj0069 family protein [Betaproteobacteria bacterium]